jgi:peptidoglycan hydrolase-like protein with peptidoglycan-binding domain
MGLSTDQVKQLQQAINQNGCNAGAADGQFGPETRQGVQCIRQQKNITEKGLNPVLQALNLGFTASPSGADTSSAGGQRRMHPDTTGAANQQQYQAPKKAQHGRGMHDSTTSKSDTSHKQ